MLLYSGFTIYKAFIQENRWKHANKYMMWNYKKRSCKNVIREQNVGLWANTPMTELPRRYTPDSGKSIGAYS